MLALGLGADIVIRTGIDELGSGGIVVWIPQSIDSATFYKAVDGLHSFCSGDGHRFPISILCKRSLSRSYHSTTRGAAIGAEVGDDTYRTCHSGRWLCDHLEFVRRTSLAPQGSSEFFDVHVPDVGYKLWRNNNTIRHA